MAMRAVESITRHLTCEHMTLLLTDGEEVYKSFIEKSKIV